jgi:hypothetical protein
MGTELTSTLRRALRRPLLAAIALLLVYVGLSLGMSPDGYLGTDTGAKVATLEVMDQNDTTDPDVGYWAGDLDPDGRLHPLYQSTPREDGSWVAVTTLPMLEAGRPLYGLGGYRATLLLPMLGAVAVAFAARAVARHLGTDDEAWTVFWLVGLASPAVIYALDFWEHSIGLACMVGAVALLLDVLGGRSGARAVAAGVLLGASAVLRNETFVYALVVVGAICAAMWVRDRSPRRPIVTGALTVAGFAGPWLGNVALERAIGAPSRSTRATSTAGRFGSDIGDRVKEGLQTLFGFSSGELVESVLLGMVVVAVILVAFRAEARGDRRFAAVCLVAAGCAYVFGALGGLGFIAGLLLAFPMAVAGLVQAARMAQGRLVAGIAIGALPLVYLVQYLGGAAPQWGGRYTLTSGILLGVVGMVGLSQRFPTVARGLVVLSAGVTALGVAWLGVRSHGVERFFDDVVERAEPVVISRNAFLLREGGAATVGERWLSVRDEETFTEAVDVARAVGEQRFSVLEWGGEAPPPEALPGDTREVDRVKLRFVDVPVGLVTYEFTG